MTHDPREQVLLLPQNAQGIHFGHHINQTQQREREFRNQVAQKEFHLYLDEISKHHSIQVMDREIQLALHHCPLGGHILDAGGGWGWHWRKLAQLRPDVQVFLVDFCEGNMIHAKRLLGEQVGKNIHLIHADILHLPFQDQSFDIYWTVQALQHTGNFAQGVSEAHRVLKIGGHFFNYSFNNAALVRFIYCFLNRRYHTTGRLSEELILDRADKKQKDVVNEIFQSPVTERFSEILFQPGLLPQCGDESSFLGYIDGLLSSNWPLWSLWARQRAFICQK